MSIRARLALGAGIQTALVVLLVAAAQFLALRTFLAQAEFQRLTLLLPVLERALARGDAPPTGRPRDIKTLPRNVDVRVIQGGQVIAVTPSFPPIPLVLGAGYRPLAGHEVLVAPIALNGQAATAQLASDVLGVTNPLRAYLRALALTAPAAALLVTLLSFLLAGRLLRPLSRLEAAAEAVGRGGTLRAPLPGTGRPDELGRLASVLQTTFGQLAAVREHEAEFTQAAAHDLRSPLAALKTRLQGALSGPRTPAELRAEIAEALSDVERMRQLTDHLLLLARGEREVQRLPVDLAQLVGEAVDRAREQAPDVRLDFESRGDTGLVGDAALLTHLIENLIGNGLRHGNGAPMQVVVSGEPGHLRLSVQDTGPGVPPEALGRLTEPFYRLDRARGGEGNGLGLAIARRVAQAHGAALHLAHGQPSGLLVSLDFPRVGLDGCPAT